MTSTTEPGTREGAERIAPHYAVVAHGSLGERRARILKSGDTFAVLDPSGDVLSGRDSSDGLFHRDTRHLSHLDLTIAAERPILLSSVMRDDNASLTCDLTNGDLQDADGVVVLEHDLVHVRRSKFLHGDAAYERIGVRSFADRPLTLEIALRFAADFADLFEVRGAKRARRGRYLAPEVGADTVRLVYVGLDEVARTTRLRFAPAPTTLGPDRATFTVALQPGGQAVLNLEVGFTETAPAAAPEVRFRTAALEARRALRRASSRAASVATSHEQLNGALRRATSDLAMLATDTPHGPYPYAGTPWFSAAFGRDALITAFHMLWLDPAVAGGVLRFLAAHQADREDAASDAEPGKILHEMRYGEMAALGEVPFRRYYGTIDATPLFVMLAGAYLARTDDVATIRTLLPAIERALAWIDDYGDRDGDGFVEYGRRMHSGLQNQGWKDSHDSIFHADGGFAEGPIALCEVQAYVYGAKRAAADIAVRLGDDTRAKRLGGEAEALAARFADAFWCADLGTYAIALDGEKRPCRVRSSNAGHALFTGIASEAHAADVAHTLMGEASFSGWGVRTLARGEARYNPISYHNGSVWPHDNALIATGLARYGFRHEAARILDGLFHASTYMDLQRLPELFCGFARRPGQGPTLYPVACLPQAWAAATPFALIAACLGLRIDPRGQVVRLDRPILPAFLDEIVVRNLSVGPGRIDLAVRRAGAEVVAHAQARTPGVRVEVAT
ncbi:amylo-alpha-1,6-glucosidase [Salinarimonas chemoclinalis]|uniref:amylo-alpha-1,6-glucosidase n=1 Tax=Salinarimonas chemoclinalis TaxID=3241599 RepID=UPI0035589322